MPSCDLLFTNATLIDGTGATRRTGALAVTDGRIVALGDCSGWQAAHTVDATGRVLAPGFIDVHTHDDSALLNTPAMPAKTSQGVTSVIAGNCGISIAPLTPTHGLPQPLMLLGEVSDYRFPSVADYRRALEASPPSV
ncbi:MAG TPA: D-aminoacylase, partial [Cupriavidus sp.]|nr:D-aminoacylase [Cupriavidus sp.]